MDYQQVTDIVVDRGLSQRGVPFSWAGGGVTGPTRGTGTGINTVGFDASGLMQYAYAGAGIKLPRSSGAMYRVGQKVAPQQARKGDLIFYGPEGTQSVAMYLGQQPDARGRRRRPGLAGAQQRHDALTWSGSSATPGAGAAGAATAGARQQAPLQQSPGQQTPQQLPGQQAPLQQAPDQQAPLQQCPASSHRSSCRRSRRRLQQAPLQQAPFQQAPAQQVPTQQSPLQPTGAAGCRRQFPGRSWPPAPPLAPRRPARTVCDPLSSLPARASGASGGFR